MPPLPKFFRDLVATHELPLDAGDVIGLQRMPVGALKVIADQAIDLLGDGAGTAMVEAGLSRRSVPKLITAEALKADAGFKKLLKNGTFSASDADTVKLVQRALQAIAARVPGTRAALRLTGWGADGDFGQETVAGVTAFQTSQGITADGAVGAEFAKALVAALGDAPVPDFFKAVPVDRRVSAGARRMVQIAEGICGATPEAPFTQSVRGRRYSYAARTFGTEAHVRGRLSAPGGVSYGLRPGTSYWKCNIFAGTVISLAGVPVSSFRWSDRSETLHYPRAEKFGDRLARKRGWDMVRYLDHRDPDDETRPLTGTSQNAEIAELLELVMPGDLLFVDHPGRPGEDGGHCRVATAPLEDGDDDLAPAFAQASHDAARIKRDGMSKLGNGAEIQFWLVRYTG